MGEVFLSRTRSGRPVAVKMAWPAIARDPEFRARFVDEVEAARRVSGYYTAPVIDADPLADRPWMATEYVPGPSLHEAVDEHGPLPVDLVRLLGVGLAEGLTAIHGSGLVHRDLKPANVLLAEDGPRVIDFGISQALEATTVGTTSGPAMGTPAYMSPEQARGGRTSPASDVFSLGCVLGFAATGRALFGTGRTQAVLYRVIHESANLDDVPSGLAPLVEECLAKDAADRPTIAQIAAELSTSRHRDARWQLPAAVATMARRRGEAVGIPAAVVDEVESSAVSDPTLVRDTARPVSAPPDPALEPGTEKRVQARRRGRHALLAWAGAGVGVLVLAVAGALVLRGVTGWLAQGADGPNDTVTETGTDSTVAGPIVPENDTKPFDYEDRLARHVVELEVSGMSAEAPARLNYSGQLDVGPRDAIDLERFGREESDWIETTTGWEDRLLVDGVLVAMELVVEGAAHDLTCRIVVDGDLVSKETRSIDDGTRCAVLDRNYELLTEDSS